jgi:hypothetical protein
MLKHYAWPAADEGYEYIGQWTEGTQPSGAVECTDPPDLQITGYIRFNTLSQDWYWPASAVLRYERNWRDQQWPDADHGQRTGLTIKMLLPTGQITRRLSQILFCAHKNQRPVKGEAWQTI